MFVLAWKSELKFKDHNANGFVWKKTWILRETSVIKPSSLAETIALSSVFEIRGF